VIVWSIEHSVEAAVDLESAWRFWTNVSNWRFDPSLEWVTLEPGLVTGAKGVTKPRGGDPIEWLVRDTELGRATIEMGFPGALVSFSVDIHTSGAWPHLHHTGRGSFRTASA
jgi:hypothetical protein